MVIKNLKKVICVATIVVVTLCYAKNASCQCYYPPTMRSLKPSHCWATTYLK